MSRAQPSSIGPSGSCASVRYPLPRFTEKPVQCGVLEKTRHIGITIEGVAAPTCAKRRVEDLALTEREKQLCVLLCRDSSREDIADAMGVSVGTTITHKSSIYAKLGVHNRVELLAALLPG
jgi:DNA-binding CsgD family transcriptional regulator